MSIIQKIFMTKPAGITLGTARKYCPHDLRVVPRLMKLTAKANGSYPIPDGCVGWGEVTVQTGGESVPLIVTKNGTYTPPAGKSFSSVTVRVGAGEDEGAAEQGSYALTPGDTFTLAYAGSSPTVTCPACLQYTDDGGILLFTAVAVTDAPQTLTLTQGDTVLGEYTVTVTATAAGEDHIHSYTATVTPPTCESGGYTTHTCTVCGDSYTDTPTAPLGHDWSEPYASDTFSSGFGHDCLRAGCGVSEETDECPHPAESLTVTVTAEPTCTEEGARELSCGQCGKRWTETLPTVAHAYRATAVEATCEKGGYTVHVCDRCGHTYIDGETDPNGHNFAGGWTVETEPTCTATGVRTRTCLTCGHTESGILAALSHDWEYYEDTASSSGYARRCTRCGEVETDVTPE